MNTPVSGCSVTSVSGHRGFPSYLNITLPALCYYNVTPLIYNTRKMSSLQHSPIFNGKSMVKVFNWWWIFFWLNYHINQGIYIYANTQTHHIQYNNGEQSKNKKKEQQSIKSNGVESIHGAEWSFSLRMDLKVQVFMYLVILHNIRAEQWYGLTYKIWHYLFSRMILWKRMHIFQSNKQ
jgi:hypothetical protein